MNASSQSRPLIMITNDDSINAPGLLRLVDTALPLGDVIVVAPAQPQSGMSSAISVNKPLRISARPDYRGARMFTVTGTPVDCVKLGLHAITPRKPDLLLSGINHGSNSGNAITYSGTMGAVIEACTNGITAIGYSLIHHSLKADFSMCLPWVDRITRAVMADGGLPQGICLNVNMPAMVEPKGIKVCRAARGHWSEEYRRYLDPQGDPFYWLTGRFINEEADATDTDEHWLHNDYISVVPATGDQTATSFIPHLTSLLA